MSNYLNSTHNPPIHKTPEDIIRNLQLQLAQRAAGGSGLASTGYRHAREKRKAPHEDPIWDSKVTGPGCEVVGPQTVKRRGNQFAERAGELRLYLDVLRQHEAEPYTLATSSPRPPLPPASGLSFMRLPCPVIIPQRRIMNRSRGFICNYSPSLRDAGINEKSFSNFINQLNRLAELKPRAQAIDFTGFAHLCYNAHHDLFVSMAVGMAFETAKGIQHGTAINKLIEKTNDELFKPKGLACLLMTWKPEDAESLSSDRGVKAKTVPVAKHERRGRTQRSKAKVSRIQGMGMFEWPQATSLDRIDGAANVISETGISTASSHHSMRNHGTAAIYSQTAQRVVVHHLENRRGIQIGAPAYSQEGIPFQSAENGGLRSLEPHGQMNLGTLGRCSNSEEKEISGHGLGTFWDPAPFLSTGDAKEEQSEDRYLRKDLMNADPSSSILSPSFTTGALKALETETLYILIANMPDDHETQDDKSWGS